MKKKTPKTPTTGLTFEPCFHQSPTHPRDAISWAECDVEIGTTFSQKKVVAPEFWSPLAVKIAASKYFYGDQSLGTDPSKGGRECSVDQLVTRVVDTITDWGIQDGYFASQKDALAFRHDLYWLCVHQFGAFNSPVWFNVGLHHVYGIGGQGGGSFRWDEKEGRAVPTTNHYEYPQGSACFLLSVKDNLEDIMALVSKEARLFKYGSGCGTNLSSLRSTREKLSGGGKPSGPISFLKVYDRVAAVTKSGGISRRAAKMNMLDAWHPDIEEFIEIKTLEEEKAHALIAQGYSSDFNGAAYDTVAFQNENLSVRASHAFMEAAIDGEPWWTKNVTDGQSCEQKDARALLTKIAQGTWFCGDPGMVFDDTVNEWHTCKASGPIRTTNPCGEVHFLDDIACNLASLNLVKFQELINGPSAECFMAACRIFLTAQDILIDHSSYPTPEVAENSHAYRPLGLGYANLGSLLMRNGLAYDSDEGRSLAGAITALMTGAAYEHSAQMAQVKGAFSAIQKADDAGNTNGAYMEEVIDLHYGYVTAGRAHHFEAGGLMRAGHIWLAAQNIWHSGIALARTSATGGFRNSQVTVLAPTGTIGFMMDCDTTGVEPELALVRTKHLAGGGELQLVNQGVEVALVSLGYGLQERQEILNHLSLYGTIETVNSGPGIQKASGLKSEHLDVFDCAFAPAMGKRFIHSSGHLEMLAAVQPFISGSISKTINMPENSTVEDIREIYLRAWRLGLKAVAIYRDGSKRSAPISIDKKKKEDLSKKGGSDLSGIDWKERAEQLEQEMGELLTKVNNPIRIHLPATRNSITHKFSVGGQEGYITVGMYENGTPGELFIQMAKEGTTVGGLMDTVGTLSSISLQYGVPIEKLVSKFSFQRFEPSGFTGNPDIRNATSVIDYVFRWLGCQFIPGYREATAPRQHEDKQQDSPVPALAPKSAAAQESQPEALKVALPIYMDVVCGHCGSDRVVRAGACGCCTECGTTTGCS